MGFVETKECMYGYVTWKWCESSRYTFHSPGLLLVGLAKELRVHQYLTLSDISALTSDNFELPLLDMIHARMRLHAGSECLLSDIFHGACGSNKAMTVKMQIASKIVFGEEAAQFYVSNGSKNGFNHSGDEGMVLQCGTDFQHPFGNSEQSVITKMYINSLGVDMRVFARHGDSKIEIWAQAKGRTSPLGWSQEEGIRMGDTAKFSKMYEHTLLVDGTGLNVFMLDVMQQYYNY
ncbi:hypothetical protein SELMODRAFT_406177 [Selaginella moellendorffii]|uniref:Uncharacterized protein n=1 Tax=Selaginella moellendorffii TaxID=88036 RepID=D8R1I3_SELML|nr:hypothetical protein SELMODRAFT_406177 [Selaginella moellendorffii]